MSDQPTKFGLGVGASVPQPGLRPAAAPGNVTSGQPAVKAAAAPLSPNTPQAPTQSPQGYNQPPAPKSGVEEIIRAWAADLTPRHAPPQAAKGPLAWVRETKVPELLELLKGAR